MRPNSSGYKFGIRLGRKSSFLWPGQTFKSTTEGTYAVEVHLQGTSLLRTKVAQLRIVLGAALQFSSAEILLAPVAAAVYGCLVAVPSRVRSLLLLLLFPLLLFVVLERQE